MYKIITFLLLFQNLICLSQSDKLENNTEQNVEYITGKTRYFTIAGNSDIINSISGLEISNGVNEKPILHFEDLTNDVLYKLSGQTNFNQSYSYGAMIGWNTPSKRLLLFTITLLEINYSQREIIEEHFFQKKINLSTDIYVKPLRLTIIGKIGFNQINLLDNFGGEIGLRKSFRGFYIGSNFGYYSDFHTISVFTQCNLYKKKLFARVTFEQIENFDSLNIGLHYTLKYR